MPIPIRTIGAVLLSLVVVAFAMAPAAAAQQTQDDTFACDPGFYQVIAGQFAQFDPGAGSYDTLGPDQSNYNAMGYRISDGYMYAVAGSNLYRINAFGHLAVVAELDANTRGYTGDFGDDGLLHVSRGGSDWTTINVDTLATTSVPELSVPAGMADITNVNGLFYGVSSQGDLVRIDPLALTVDVVGAVEGLPASSMAYGAAWSTAGGNLYIGRNSGEIYQITGYSTSSPVATQVGTAPPTNSNDGASCSLAPPPPGLADVDGPEPETQPSTPEAQAAAEQYQQTYEPTPVPDPATEPTEPEPETGDPAETYTVDPDEIEGGEVCGDSPVEVRPPRDLVGEITSVDTETELYSSRFDDGPASGWQFLSGEWVLSDGALQQVTECDFDATALLTTHTVSHFRWTTSFVANDGRNHGGVLFHQSSPNTRSGATLVDFADNGSAIRWGSYNNSGFYVFAGMQSLPPVAAGELVNLSIEVQGTFVEVSVDGDVVAYFESPEAAGMVGLVATKSVVSFEHARLVALPAEVLELEEPAEEDAPVTEHAPAEEDAPEESEPDPDPEPEPVETTSETEEPA